jgi:hypothetical protein
VAHEAVDAEGKKSRSVVLQAAEKALETAK